LVLKHWGQDQLDDDREDDDGDTERTDGIGNRIAVQAREQPAQNRVDGNADDRPPQQPDWVPKLTDRAHGTGSQPPAWNGWQRASRPSAMPQPRDQPER